jgi:tetratricopeptide (TPR) repeat protein
MMTISNIQPQSAASLHGLRDALEQAERQIVRLDRTNIQEFLVQLDQIEQMWTEYDDPSAMRSEEARWQSLLKRITTSPQLVTAAAAQVGGLTKLRSQHFPATGLWWHVDEQVAEQRNQRSRRLGLIVGVVALVVLAFWIINNVMSRNAATAGMVEPLQQVDQLVENQSWQEALNVVESARQSSPEDVDLLVWDSVLAEQTGSSERSQSSLNQAQKLFVGSPAAFWTLVGNYRLQAGNWDGAEEVGQQALALAPEDAEVTFLLGRVAEARGDMAQATEYYNQTLTLAGDSNLELVALVKIRMGFLTQNAGPMPGAAPTPGSTQTATP